jgi:hypothetical protein
MSCPECLGLQCYYLMVGIDDFSNDWDGWTLERRTCATCAVVEPTTAPAVVSPEDAPYCPVCASCQLSVQMLPGQGGLIYGHSTCTFQGCGDPNIAWHCPMEHRSTFNPFAVRRCAQHKPK